MIDFDIWYKNQFGKIPTDDERIKSFKRMNSARIEYEKQKEIYDSIINRENIYFSAMKGWNAKTLLDKKTKKEGV